MPAAIVTVWLLGLAVASLPGKLQGDEFMLRSGGLVTGKLLNPDEKPRRMFRIETSVGRIDISADQVKEVRAPSEKLLQYRELLTRMPATADGNWKMSVWCQQSYLEDQRLVHLEKCIDLEPNHEEARRALGYTLHDGEWALADVLNRRQGLIRHGHRWQLPAEVLLERAAEARELEEKQWTKQIRMWTSWHNSRKWAEGQRQLLAVRDPAAVPALSRMLEEENSEDLKRIAIRVLHAIGSEAGSLALINEVLKTKSPTVRSDCFDALRDMGRLRAIAAFTAKLKSPDNATVNLAAIGLGTLKAQEAVPELIDALITKHKERIGSGSPGSISPTFSNGGGGGLGGFSMGGGAKEVEVPKTNAGVRDALVALTGVNHRFDQEAWRQWLVQTSKPVSYQLRRGP
ncbi:MAG: HEAT repeat domain-containing protein [Planctomycetales bacterium]|nr:HEAT repeat domain-containing protein [Planctomycetales bacterium]